MRGNVAGKEPHPWGMHPLCTPMLSGTRDVWEFSDDPILEQLRRSDFQFLRALPEQYNLNRWSLVARQTGLYEYMYGQGFVAPRIYTRRLFNAITRGYREARARVFVAETLPNLGFDAIQLYETAQILWNGTTLGAPDRVAGDSTSYLRELRMEFCQRAFTEGSNDGAVLPMFQYFETLEAAWGSRPAHEQRFAPGTFSTYLGQGIIGKMGWITQLDYLLRSPRTGEVLPLRTLSGEPNPDLPFNQAWSRLQTAYAQSSGRALQRVQLFRKAFGLVRELVQVYHPILDAWVLLERAQVVSETTRRLESVVQHTYYDPIRWMVSYGIDRVRRVEGLAAAIAAKIDPANGFPFGTPTGFRRDVRERIHRYIAKEDLYGTTGELTELGLGLGQYSDSERLFLVNPTLLRRQIAERHALWLPSLVEYMLWWNGDRNTWPTEVRGTSAQRNAISRSMTWDEGLLPDGIQDGDTIGPVMFWSMKRMYTALLLASRAPAETERVNTYQTGLFFLCDG